MSSPNDMLPGRAGAEQENSSLDTARTVEGREYASVRAQLQGHCYGSAQKLPGRLRSGEQQEDREQQTTAAAYEG